MRESLTKVLFAALALGASASAVAQNSGTIELLPPPPRDASFTANGSSSSETGFSGLATAPPTALAPPAPQATSAPPPAPEPSPISSSTPLAVANPAAAEMPATTPAPTQSSSPASALPPPPTPDQIRSAQGSPTVPPASIPLSSSTPAAARPADLAEPPLNAAALPNAGVESLGVQTSAGLGSDIWKGTPRSVAEALLASVAVTQSPLLNNLAQRLLMTAAVPPDATGSAQSATPSLTARRIDRLIAFGAVREAWALAKQADPSLVDDATYKLALETALTLNNPDPCATIADISKARATGDWQEAEVICFLRVKDTNSARTLLEGMRTQTGRDPVFMDIATKNFIGDEKKLPFRLTPLTAPSLSLLQLTALPLPGELYVHVDNALIPGLLHTTPQQDVAQLALAENAAQRGIITSAELENVYRSISFSEDALNTPLLAPESGLRLRALLFRAAERQQDAGKRITYAVKFAQSSPAAFIYGAGGIAADMIGDAKPDTGMAANAVTIAKLYMIAGRGDAALGWLRVAQTDAANGPDLQALWPQFVLAGMEPDNAYANDVGQWLEAALKQPSNNALDKVRISLMLLEAAGFKVPEAAWTRIYESPGSEIKKVALPPVLFDRLMAAGGAGRKAETILLALATVGNGDIALTQAVAITRALREVGLKSEAAIFARQMLALMTP